MSTEEPIVIAIDQGTTSARAVAFNERALPVAVHQVELTQIYPRPGWVEHDPLQLVEACRQCVTNVSDQLTAKGINLDQVKALGIANQRETAVLWDRRTGAPVGNAIVWSDTRTAHLVKELQKRPDAQKVKDLSGLYINAYFAATKVRWQLDNNEMVRRIYEEGELCFGTVDSWLVYALSGGEAHITDASNASRSMLLNLAKREYDPELIAFFGFEKLVLPEIKTSSEVYGNLYMPGESLDGLPIAGCVGDQAAALVGHMGFKRGDAKNTYGTGCFLMYNTGTEPVLTDNGLLTTIAYQIPGEKPHYALEGSIAVCGSVIKWLRNNLGLIETSDQVGDMIESVPDTAGVYFVTAFNGLFSPYWSDSARGTIVGITAYSTKAHITRAAIEAVCYQSREIYDVMKRETQTTEEMEAKSKRERSKIAEQTKNDVLKVDGGLTSSDVIMQLQADIAGVDIMRPAMKEVTALGAAVMAGLAVGVWKSLAEVEYKQKESAALTAYFSPNTGTYQRDRGFKQWHRAVEKAMNWHIEEDENEQEEES